jgi:2-octaprenyl-6-methoxyphenol hydroxylase
MDKGARRRNCAAMTGDTNASVDAQTQKPIIADATIVGAGMTGLILAAALAGGGLRVAVIDRADPAGMTAATFDGRTTAIAAGSRRVLEGIGLWGELDGKSCPIDDIRVSDGDSLLFLHYDHTEIGDEPLGHIVDNRDIRDVLFARAETHPNITLLAPAEIADLERGAAGVRIALASGQAVRARVVLACDGRFSGLRRDAGIPVTEWRYDQSSMICNIVHERSHGNVAHERFLPGGPFAILPLPDAPEEIEGLRHRASIVWSEANTLVPVLTDMDDDAFTAELAGKVGGFLGRIALASPRRVHPLGLSHAVRYTDSRLALVGDAAHAIHPIAGQGLNMGIRDVAALAEVLVDARRLGRDIGDPDILDAYARWRRFDNMLLAVVTDGLTRIFSNDVVPLRAARRIGLAAVNAAPPARRNLMRHAMGTVGELPRLVRGEAL